VKHPEPRGVVTKNPRDGNWLQVETEYGTGKWPFNSVHNLTPGFQIRGDIDEGTEVTLRYISYAGGALWFARESG
jgi:hypothetical protein